MALQTLSEATPIGGGFIPSFARRYSEGWLKPCSNVRRRQMIALNDRTRLTDSLGTYLFF